MAPHWLRLGHFTRAYEIQFSRRGAALAGEGRADA